MQQQQADGSYNEFWPKTDCYTKAQSLNSTTAASMGLGSSSVPSDVIQEIVNYGLVATQGKYVSNFNNLTRGGLYYWDENSQNSPISGSGAAMVIPNSNGRYVFVSDISQRKYERYYINSQWTNWIYINPPFVAGQEYLTSEFRNGVSVVKKLDADGIMKWRLSTESTWHVEGGVDNNDLVQQGYTKLGVFTSDSNTASFSVSQGNYPSEILIKLINVSGSRTSDYNSYSEVTLNFSNANDRRDDGENVICVHGVSDVYDVGGIIKFNLLFIGRDNQNTSYAQYGNCNQIANTSDNWDVSTFYVYSNTDVAIKEWRRGTIEIWEK